MKNSRTALWIIAIMLLTLILAGCDTINSSDANVIQASGVIEARQVSVAPEVNGKVVEVYVDEGQAVQEGDPLLKIEDELLSAQREVLITTLDAARAAVVTAQAGVDAAQAQYDLTLAAAQSADYQARNDEWLLTSPDEFDQNDWYFTEEDRLAAAENEADAARVSLEDALTRLEKIESNAASSDFLAAEKRLLEARSAFMVAQSVLDQAKAAGDADLEDAAQTAFDDAQEELDNAQTQYDDLFNTEGAADVLKARAERAVAEARYRTASLNLLAWQTGERAPEVVAAAKVVDQAQAGVEQAQSAVTQAEAQLAELDLQMQKLTISSPKTGVVLSRSVEPGEIARSGAVVFTIGDLSDLSVIVYIPENHYGQIALGDTAQLTVDSFPDKTFTATVTHIADQAEYTPRNVQTKEERQTTVYAVKLAVDNPDDELKPGMPADVSFEQP